MSPFQPYRQTKARTPLAEWRLRRRVTQKQMWTALGIGRTTYLKLERGDYDNPPLRYLTNAALLLRVDVSQLIQDNWREWWQPTDDAPEFTKPVDLWAPPD